MPADNALSPAVPGALLAAALLLSGCAAEPPATQISEHLPPPPAVKLGPEFEVFKGSRLSYVANGVMDSAGHVQMIVGKKGELRHLSIGPQGVESSEVVRANYYALRTDRYIPIGKHEGQETPYFVDLALDRAGNLHVLADDEHFVKKDGNWIGGQRTPCQEGKVKTPLDGCGDISFVKGMPDLTWAFYAWGHQMGFPYTWRNKTVAVGPADHHRLLIVPEETPYRNFHVLVANYELDAWAQDVVGNRHNAIHAISYFKLLSFNLGGECPRPDPHAWHQQEKNTLKLPIAGTLCPVDAVPFYRWHANEHDPETGSVNPLVQKFNEFHSYYPDPPEYAYVVDPDTGHALVVNGNGASLEADTAQNRLFAELPISHFAPYVQAVGGGRFYALMMGTARPAGDYRPVYFLEYFNGAWSAPVEIGTTQGPPFNDVHDVFNIISDHAGRALLIWPTDDALVARWVKLK